MYDEEIIFDILITGGLNQLKSVYSHGVGISPISIKHIITYGNVKMLNWLESIGCTFDDPSINMITGSIYDIDIIKWLTSKGFKWSYIALLSCEISHNYDVMELIFDSVYNQ